MAEKSSHSPESSVKDMTEKQETVTPEVLAVEHAPTTELQRFYADFAARDGESKQSFEKKLVRKIDIRLLPLLVIMYLNNFLDRSALAQARIGTLEEDLGMKPSGTDFSLATSILFVGYILGQPPSNLLLTRLRPSWYLGIVMGVWGVVCALTAVVQNLGGLIAVRAFLGVTEAPFFPGAVPAFQIIVAWVSNSFIRPTVKRSAAIAICNPSGNSATIYGAYMYPLSDRPGYFPGGAATAVICLLVAALAFVLRLVHIHENRKLENGRE